LRSVTPEGVAVVMAEFRRAYLGRVADVHPAPDRPATPDRRAEHEALADVICDEEANET